MALDTDIPGETPQDRARNRREWLDEAEQLQIDEGDITPSETGYGQSPVRADNFFDNSRDGSPITDELLDEESLDDEGMHIEDLNADDVLSDDYDVDDIEIEGLDVGELNLKDEDAEALDAEDEG